jgi:hypothetical protein
MVSIWFFTSDRVRLRRPTAGAALQGDIYEGRPFLDSKVCLADSTADFPWWMLPFLAGHPEFTEMYIIRLERGRIEADRVVMWLSNIVQQRWGYRLAARRFPTKGDVLRAVRSIKIVGAWSIEKAEG